MYEYYEPSAHALFIEVRTVKHHIHYKLEKMAVGRRSETVRVATKSALAG